MGILFSSKQQYIFILIVLSFAQKPYVHAKKYFHFIDPFAINVAGNHVIIQNQIYDWSLGELVIGTFNTTPLLYISLGFLQSQYYPLLQYNNVDSFALQIKIGPNPFSNFIILQSEQDQIVINAIQLVDFQGKILYQLKGDYSGHDFYLKMSIGKLISPICLLHINYTISGQIYKSKFFKLLQN